MAAEKILEKPSLEKIVAAPTKLEQPLNPEAKIEPGVVKVDQQSEKKQVEGKKGEAISIVAPSSAQNFQKQRAIAIDNILAEGLNEVFIGMNAQQQKEFKQKGEETVTKINLLLSQAKVKVNKIIDLIRAWLKFVPGINKFFLEQEVKIKADKILKIKDKF